MNGPYQLDLFIAYAKVLQAGMLNDFKAFF
jgi:hypothetical protein